jgi:nucleotide-binding universal stress UspA family protein
MHNTSLVGLDNSPGSWHAFEKTLAYAARVHARVVGLFVEAPHWRPPAAGKSAEEESVRINATRMANLQGVPFEYRVRHGYAASTIAGQARLLGCDLVVLGHAGDALLRRWLTTSVSNLVAHQAPCRVVVVRTGQVLDFDQAPPDPTVSALPV